MSGCNWYPVLSQKFMGEVPTAMPSSDNPFILAAILSSVTRHFELGASFLQMMKQENNSVLDKISQIQVHVRFWFK
jgi:hypothetical protein